MHDSHLLLHSKPVDLEKEEEPVDNHSVVGRLQRLLDDEDENEQDEKFVQHTGNETAAVVPSSSTDISSIAEIEYSRWKALQQLAAAIGDKRNTAKLEKMFDHFDLDHNGELDSAEFTLMLKVRVV
jgi:hypothetical protein